MTGRQAGRGDGHGLARFGGNPYCVFGRRLIRERRIRAYIHRQHRAGRCLTEILGDAKLAALGSPTLVWKVLADPDTLRALGDDVREEIDREFDRIRCSARG